MPASTLVAWAKAYSSARNGTRARDSGRARTASSEKATAPTRWPGADQHPGEGGGGRRHHRPFAAAHRGGGVEGDDHVPHRARLAGERPGDERTGAEAGPHRLTGREVAGPVAGPEGAHGEDLLPHRPPAGAGRRRPGRRRQRRSELQQVVEEAGRLVVTEGVPRRLLLFGRRRPVARRLERHDDGQPLVTGVGVPAIRVFAGRAGAVDQVRRSAAGPRPRPGGPAHRRRHRVAPAGGAAASRGPRPGRHHRCQAAATEPCSGRRRSRPAPASPARPGRLRPAGGGAASGTTATAQRARAAGSQGDARPGRRRRRPRGAPASRCVGPQTRGGPAARPAGRPGPPPASP